LSSKKKNVRVGTQTLHNYSDDFSRGSTEFLVSMPASASLVRLGFPEQRSGDWWSPQSLLARSYRPPKILANNKKKTAPETGAGGIYTKS